MVAYRNMRQIYLIFLAGLLIVAAFLLANWRTSVVNQPSDTLPEISLTNLPESYCPDEAEIYHTSNLAGSSRIAVVNCNIISLKNLGLADAETVFVKLPNALAFSIAYTTEVDRYLVGVRVGDATGDNIIDGDDEKLITDQMFGQSRQSDVDLSGEVTANDLALSIINAAVGLSRPDGKGWEL